MNSLLRSFKIPARLFSQLGLFTIGIIVLLVLGLNQLHTELLRNKSTSTQTLVETAYSVLKTQYDLSQTGAITEAEAKREALKTIENLRYDGGNYFWVNDMTATMVMHPIKPALNGKDLSEFKDKGGKKLFSEFVKVVKANGEGQVDYMWPAPGGGDAVTKISYVKGFKPWGYIIGSGVYIQDVDAAFWAAAPTKIIVGVITMLLISFASYMIARSVTSPVINIVNALKNIAAGDGDLTQRLPKTGNDEVTALAGAFNSFVEKVHMLVKQTADTAESVTAASDKSNDISITIHQSVTKQKSQTDNVAMAMEQMSQSTHNVSANASEAAESAGKANTSCENAKNVVAEGISSVKSLVTEVEKASDVINNLQGDVGEIVTVLEVIRGIAEQTNLLALNAAIEAARAGEQGRGFAVVADEVRTLASRTQDSTQEIQNMIERLQQGSKEAVNVMESSKGVGEKTMEHSISTGKSLDDIAQEVSTITGMNSEIANAAQEQNKMVDSINHSIASILEESNSTANASSLSQQTAADLSANAKALTSLIKQFKI